MKFVAVAAALGAWWAYPLPKMLCVLPLLSALLYRRVRVVGLMLGVFILASHFAAASNVAMAEPLTYEGEATLVGDPSWFGASVRVNLKVENRRYEAWASGDSARTLGRLLTGEKVLMRGRIGPTEATWLRTRHIMGRITVWEVTETRPANAIYGAANQLRRTLERGSTSLGYERQSLFLGLVIGDDRNQSAALADAFAGSGLTHLLAVSGSNVAFVVSLANPLLKHFRKTFRWVATLALLAFFVLVTRFEPSVLRAGVMAGVATTGTLLGHRNQTKTILAISVTALLIIDPFLVRSLAFQLSVAASAGILWFSEGLTAALAPLRALANPLAVTMAAQLAVAPILIPAFGSMPLAALPANLLAAPVAGPVMMWGIGAGIPAGIAPPNLARLLHLPTRAMVWWIDEVARRSANLPLGSMRLWHLVLIVLAGLVVKNLRYFDATAVYLRIGVVVLLALALTNPVVESVRTPSFLVKPSEAVEIYRAGGATVVKLGSTKNVKATLEQLREAHIRKIDVLVSQYGGRPSAEVVAAITTIYSPKLILAPTQHRIPGASVLDEGGQVQVGELVVQVIRNQPELETQLTTSRGKSSWP